MNVSNVVDLASTGNNYKSLNWCHDNGYMADYLKYIGYGLYTDDNAVVKNYENWCDAQNGRLWAELGTWFPPFMPFPKYFDASGKSTRLVEYKCYVGKRDGVSIEQMKQKYEDMKEALGKDRSTTWFTGSCGSLGYWEYGTTLFIEVIR